MKREDDLLLEGEDVGDTAIDGILKPSLGLIRNGDSSLTALSEWKTSEKLRDIAGPKDLVNGSKMGGTLFMAEIRCKNTPSDTFPSQEFAGSTWRTRTCHSFGTNWDLISFFFFFFWITYYYFFC